MDVNHLNEEVPEKFKDTETGELKADNLLKSYKELEKKMSAAPTGAPETPEDYCVDCSKHGLFEADESVNKRMHEIGLNNEQAQGVYDLAAERMVPMIMEMAGEFEAERELEKLTQHFGGAEQWAQISQQLLTFGRKTLRPDVLDALASSFEGILALEGMMKGEEPNLATQDIKSTDSMEGKELQSMMKDPKYWRDKDPAFVAKVTEGFKKLYG